MGVRLDWHATWKQYDAGNGPVVMLEGMTICKS